MTIVFEGTALDVYVKREYQVQRCHYFEQPN